MKLQTKNFKSAIKSFYESDIYILFLAVLTLLSWTTGLWVAGVIFMLALTIIGTLISTEFKHLLAFLTLFSATMSTQTVGNAEVLLISVFAFMELIAVVANLIIHKRDWSVLHPKNVKGFTAAHVALIIPFLLAGLGGNVGNPLASLVASGFIIAITVLYVLLYVGAKNSGKNYMDYVLKCVFALSIVTCIEFVIYVLRFGDFDAIIETIKEKRLWMGWAGPNTLASVISMGLPCTFYLTIKKHKFSAVTVPLFVLIAFLQFALIVLSGCRGAMLFALMLLPSLLLYAMWQTQTKAIYFWSVAIIFVAFIFALFSFSDELSPVITKILSKGTSSSGRVEGLYPEAVSLFKLNPIFGAGWGYKLKPNLSGFYEPYLFHSTFFQFLANMGIVGVIFMVIFFLWRYFLVLPMYKNPAAVLATISLLLFDLYSMIDTSFFNPALFLLISMMSLTMELDMPEGRCLAFLGKDPTKLFKRSSKNKTKNETLK